MDIPRVEAARPKLDQGVQTVIQLNTRFSSIMYQVEGVIAGRRSIRSRLDRSAMRLRELDRQLRSLQAFMNEAETRYGGVERSLEEQAERLKKTLVQITAAWGAGLSLGGPGGIAAIGMQALVVRGVLEGLQDCWSTGLISKRNWPASPYSFANQSAQLLPYNPEKVIPMNDILNRADPEVYERLMAGPFGHMTLEQRTALIQEVEQSEKDAKRAMERFEYGSSFADGFGHGIERKIQGIVDTVDYVWTNPKGAGEALLQGIKDELVDKVKHPFKTMSMVTNPILYSMMNQLPKPETVKDFMEAGPGKKGDYIGPLFVDLVLAAAAARIKVKDLPGSKENPKIRDGDSKGAEQDVKEKEKKEQATIGAEGTGKDAKIPRTGAEWDEYFRSKYGDDNVTWVTKNNFEYVDGFDDHLINAQSIVRKGNKGVVGGHNLDSFEKILTDQGWNLDDLIVSKTPHPTIPGVYQIQYRLPALNRELKVIPDQYKNISHPKTVYDPSVISNDQIILWGKEAMANGEIVGREIRGTASNGLKFTGYLDENGKVTNFFPTISE